MTQESLIRQAYIIMDRMVELGFKTDGQIAIQAAKHAFQRVLDDIESGHIKPKK